MNVKAVHVISCVTTLRVHLSVLVEMDMRSLMREAVIVSDGSQWHIIGTGVAMATPNLCERQK